MFERSTRWIAPAAPAGVIVIGYTSALPSQHVIMWYQGIKHTKKYKSADRKDSSSHTKHSKAAVKRYKWQRDKGHTKHYQ